MNEVLETRVRGANRANAYANSLYPRLREVSVPLVGQVILKEGGLRERVEKLLHEKLGEIPCTVPLHVYRNGSNYRLCWTVKTCEDVNGHAYYYETSVQIGELDGKVLKNITPWEPLRTDYTASEFEQARIKFREARQAMQEAQSALWPFGEWDR